MNAPPVLRPLRAILQRRLQLVPSRPIRTPYNIRVSQHRSGLRSYSSIPSDQTPKPEEPTRTEQTSGDAATQSAGPEENAQAAGTGAPTEATEDVSPSQSEADAQAPQPTQTTVYQEDVVTKVEAPGHEESITTTVETVEATAVPKLDALFVKSAFQSLRASDTDVEVGISEVVSRQLEAHDAIAAAEAAAPEVVDPGVVEALAGQETEAAVQESQAKTGEKALKETEVGDVPSSTQTVAGAEAQQQTGMASETPEASASHLQAADVASTATTAPEAAAEVEAIKAFTAGVAEGKAAAEAAASEVFSSDVARDELAFSEAAARDYGVDTDTVPSKAADDASISDDTMAEAPVADNTLSTDEILDRISSEAAAARAAHLGSEATLDSPESIAAAMGKRIPKAQANRTKKFNDLSEVVEEEVNQKVAQAVEEEQEEDDSAEDEVSRLPRNVQAFYLQPLRRVAEYGVPSCDLQLRSYSVRPLESFCDFALRAAYYLGLPAYGPTPLPKITERWTVPKSSFIFKKSQENFERITRRRLIQIRDGHPETVQIWLAFLQKHQQAAVGMKANVWEFSKLAVHKYMNNAHKQSKSIINNKFHLLGQTKEFESVEKVDEYLQSARYRAAGGR